MRIYLFLLSFLLFSIPALAEDGPVVVELFTSQSCSSCPPADKFLGELAMEENIIALSCNVTYWNHLNWTDTLSQQVCTDRQRIYEAALDEGLFTPQMIINGEHSTVGFKKDDVKGAIKISKNRPIQNIELKLNDRELNIVFPTIDNSDQLLLYVVEYAPTHTQIIPTGENRGKTVNYTNPVTSITFVEDWDGSSSYNFKIYNEDGGYAALLQEATKGWIVAAGKI